MSIQREIIIKTKYKREPEEFGSRQDYLASLVRHLAKVDQDQYDDLSNEAAEWYDQAARALNQKQALPEIPGFEEIAPSTEGFHVAPPVATNGSDPSKEATPEPIPEEPKKPVVKDGKLLKDRFGVTLGTNTHEAVKMYSTGDGATLNEVAERMNGVRYYNILKKLEKRGHHVTKDPDTKKYRVIHKDDYGKQAKGEQEDGHD